MPEARSSSASGFGVRQPSGALARNTPDLRPSNAAQTVIWPGSIAPEDAIRAERAIRLSQARQSVLQQ